MRKQKLILAGYAVVAFISYLISEPLVSKFNLMGAGLVFLISMALTSLIFYLIYLFFINKKRKNEKRLSNE